ncbi:hypothetical protein IAJ44_004260 [Salmonella enterica]|nr:hypothetical protein [Salmonella enterica subsp. enterica serovar Mississippi]EGD6457199.1 hypothetical protein [Salmonella enterica]
MKQTNNNKSIRRAVLFLAIAAMTGCASHSEVDNLTDGDLCNITGQAVGLGDDALLKETGAEMMRRGRLTVSREECELIATYGLLVSKGFDFKSAEDIAREEGTAII